MTDQENTAENNTVESGNKKNGCCKPHASLYLSVVALLLAGYAAFNSSTSYDSTNIQAQLNKLDSNVSNINNQLETLSAEVQINRDNLVQTKLKKALENIRDISDIAEEESKAAIAKVEDILRNLTTMGEKLIAPEAAGTMPKAINEAPPAEPIPELKLEKSTTLESSMPTIILAKPITDAKEANQTAANETETDPSEPKQTKADETKTDPDPNESADETSPSPEPSDKNTSDNPENKTASEVSPPAPQVF